MTPTAARQPVPVILALANAARPRRDASAPGDPWTAPEQAAAFLQGLGGRAPVDDADRRACAQLAVAVSELASAVARHKSPPEPTLINALARQARGYRLLQRVPGGFGVDLLWDAPTAASDLARRIIEEWEHLDPARLRECARPACMLVFYDTTRSNTQRWHAEDPCGWLERQARHRAKSDPA